MEYVAAGRLLGAKVRVYLCDVVPLARDAAEASVEALYLTFRLLLALAFPLARVVLVLWRALAPALALVAARIWAAFCLQPAGVLAVEAAAGAAVLALVMLERRFGVLRALHGATLGVAARGVRNYRGLVSSVRTQSRSAAAALPHVLFFAGVGAGHAVFGARVAGFVQGMGLFLVACVRPAARTALLLYSVDADGVVGLSTPSVAPDLTPASARKVLQSPAPATLSGVRRRKGHVTAGGTNVSPRTRAALVASEIENDGNEPNRIVETPGENSGRADAYAGKEGKDIAGSSGTGGGTTRKKAQFADTPQRQGHGRRRTAFTVEDELAVRLRSDASMLEFWIVFGLVWSLRSLARYMFPSMLLPILAQIDTALFYFFLWAQLGFTSGAHVVYSGIASVARRRWRVSSGTASGASRAEQLNVLLRLAVATGVLSEERASTLSMTVAESGLALLGVVFFLTPRMATYVGTLLIGLVVPAYLSTAALETGTAGPLLEMSRHNWLGYWAVYSLVDAAFAATTEMLSWLPLWYHLKMAIILWLQLPYYRGSVIILDLCMGYVGSLLTSVSKSVVTPRKRKRL